MLVGYARVSTPDQHLTLQRDALKGVGCKRIFSDIASGATPDRSGLTKALEFVRRGDTLVVWKLDRLGRSLQHLIESVRQLETRRIGFRSLQESIDTTTSGGKLIFHVFGALAEFERDIIRERTNAGLAAARARGRKGGRPRVLDDKKLSLARVLYKDNTAPATICATLGISKSSLYRYLGAEKTPTAPAVAPKLAPRRLPPPRSPEPTRKSASDTPRRVAPTQRGATRAPTSG
jgi:DNA invertase Pin-like site-specific DNA recombinase